MMTELTDKELDAVSGGVTASAIGTLTQLNNAEFTGVAVTAGNIASQANATVAQIFSQLNVA
jgi:bacteriocin-like protein